LVNEQRLSELPLNGRNFNDLVLLQTGIKVLISTRMNSPSGKRPNLSLTFPTPQKSGCGKQAESFTLTHWWGTSALDGGLESVGFEVVARIRGGLRAGVGTELHAEKRRSGRKK
jgi:hypothetical protein